MELVLTLKWIIMRVFLVAVIKVVMQPLLGKLLCNDPRASCEGDSFSYEFVKIIFEQNTKEVLHSFQMQKMPYYSQYNFVGANIRCSPNPYSNPPIHRIIFPCRRQNKIK